MKTYPEFAYSNISYGVGIKFVGYPEDEERFVWLMAFHGCHEKASRRILERLKENGSDCLTVMCGLNFVDVQKHVESVGLKFEFIEAKHDWKQTYVDGEWNKSIIEKIHDARKNGLL